MSTATLAEIDVRSIPPYQRHQQIFAQVDEVQGVADADQGSCCSGGACGG